MDTIFAAILACVVTYASTAAPYPTPNPEAVANVLAGEQKTAYASWCDALAPDSKGQMVRDTK